MLVRKYPVARSITFQFFTIPGDFVLTHFHMTSDLDIFVGKAQIVNHQQFKF